MNKCLYIVATPIGNLEDITLRAINVLKAVDAIFCEDTRETRKLLDHYQIKKPTIGLHQHSLDQKVELSLNKYNQIAYVTDAGTPGISDPGNRIVEVALGLGFNIIPIPGACAAIAALSVSALPTDKFLFLGFFPKKGQQKTLELIRDSNVTTCFYESPHRIMKTLTVLKNCLDENRKVIVARELTKKFETIYRGSVEEVIVSVNEKQKGEFVVVVSGNK